MNVLIYFLIIVSLFLVVVFLIVRSIIKRNSKKIKDENERLELVKAYNFVFFPAENIFACQFHDGEALCQGYFEKLSAKTEEEIKNHPNSGLQIKAKVKEFNTGEIGRWRLVLAD